MSVKIIPTRYAGHHFRSRLEARWAVYFDAIKLPWSYEPEGYQLDGGSYLPDFKLGDGDEFFAEVKGDERRLDIALLSSFADEVGPLVLLGEIPRPVDGLEPAWQLLTHISEDPDWVCLGPWERQRRLWLAAPNDERYPGARAQGQWLTPATATDDSQDRHAKAAINALSARFESPKRRRK